MALVTITIVDTPDGKVDISLKTEPPMNIKDGEITDAQYTALSMLDAVADPDDVVTAS